MPDGSFVVICVTVLRRDLGNSSEEDRKNPKMEEKEKEKMLMMIQGQEQKRRGRRR